MVESSGLQVGCGLPKKTVSVLASLILLLAPINFVFAAQTFSYDVNGNVVSDGVYCYEYNDANQLSRVRDCASDQLIAEYLYDHSGARAVKKQYEGGVLQHTTYYIGDLFETKLYPDGSTENTSYYFVNGERVARKDPDGSMHYYHGDHLGSTSVVTDSTGNLEEKTKYYPYGLVREGGTQSRYLFTGQEKDSETGLYYYGARYYNPEIMRFAQPDSIIPDLYDPQTLNPYSYVKNNPLKYTDPTGNFFFVVGGAYIAAEVVVVSIGVSAMLVSMACTGYEYHVNQANAQANQQEQANAQANQQENNNGNDQDEDENVKSADSPSQETVEEPTGFKNKELREQHFKKHGSDFGTNTADDYEQMANKFMSNDVTEGGTTLEKVRSSGDIVRYDTITDEFAVMTKEGTIRTYYKPDPKIHGCKTNLDYFNKQ